MIKVERTFEVARPVDEVFAYLADFTTTNEWDPGTVRTTRVGDGPLGVGARFHNVSTYRGRETELDYECRRYEPDRHLTFTGTNKTVTASDDLALHATRAGTLITYRAYFRFKRYARFAEPLLRPGFEPIADETIEQLRGCLERTA